MKRVSQVNIKGLKTLTEIKKIPYSEEKKPAEIRLRVATSGELTTKQVIQCDS